MLHRLKMLDAVHDVISLVSMIKHSAVSERYVSDVTTCRDHILQSVCEQTAVSHGVKDLYDSASSYTNQYT